jgi:hypothetical protein
MRSLGPGTYRPLRETILDGGGPASSLDEDDAERWGRIVPFGRRYLTVLRETILDVKI